MNSVINLTLLIALLSTCVRSQTPDTIHLAYVPLRGTMEYGGSLLKNAQLTAKKGSLQQDICSYITEILSYVRLPRRMTSTCSISSMHEATGVINMMVSLQFKLKYYDHMALSPTFAEDTLNRVFYINNHRNGYDRKYVVPLTRTAVYLFGPVRKNHKLLIDNRTSYLGWTGSVYADAEQKICETIRSRLDEDRYFRNMQSVCRVSAFYTEGCDAMVQISFENEHLIAVGLTLDYDTVAWAVQNAVLYESMRNGDLAYQSVVQSVAYAHYYAYYMLKGPLKYRNQYLRFPTQDDAQYSETLIDAIRQLPYAASANRWMDDRYAYHGFSFKFIKYDEDDHSITLLCKMYSSGYIKNIENPDLIKKLPYPLIHDIVEYTPVVIFNERVPKPHVDKKEAEEESLIFLRRGPVDNLNQFFVGNPRNRLPDNFILQTERVCKPTSPFETVYGAVVQLNHVCVLDSFERYSLLATTRFKIPIIELKAKGLHPEDIQILWG